MSERNSRYFFWRVSMKELSIFIDESGDFGFSNGSSKYYSITLLFHDQSKDISNHIEKITNKLGNKEPVHSGPLIRRESPYYDIPIKDRRKIFNSIFFFSSTSPISYFNLIYNKKNFENPLKLQGKMSKDIYSFLFSIQDFLITFDKIKIYYDNGQYQITAIINNVFSILGFNYEIKRVAPS